MPSSSTTLARALRSLRRAPSFTAAVIASLGIAIGAIATVFAVADAVLFSPLPFRDPGSLVWVASVRPQRSDAPFSLPEFLDYSERARGLDLAAYTNWNVALGTETVGRRLQGMRISANGFAVLGARPSAGRLLQPADDRADAPRVVVLSHRFWLEEFAGDPAVVGRVLRLNEQPHEIIGVMPKNFPMPLRDLDVVSPLQPELDPRRSVRNSVNFLRFVGRLHSPGSIVAVSDELTGIAGQLRAQFPTEYASKLGVAVTPLREFLVGDTRQTFVMLLGAAALLLGIALANVLNLMLVRGIAKKGEMALRRALGATGRELAVSAAAEALLLASGGAAIGALAAVLTTTLIADSSLAVLRLDEVHVGARTLLLVSAISIVAALLFSAIPLASYLRTAPRQALAAIGRGMHGSRGEARLRSAFLVAQVGFAVLLTIVSATLASSLVRLQSVDLGYRPDSTFLARLSLPPTKAQSVEMLARFAEQLEGALRATPGVVSAGAISVAPLSGQLAAVPFSISGRPPAQAGERLEANYRAVTPGYFAAVRARVRRGRAFTAADDGNAEHVIAISRALEERFFDGQDALGKVLMLNDNNAGPRPVTIVGILEDMRHIDVAGAAPFDIYFPMAQLNRDWLGFVSGSQFWAVRVAGGANFSDQFARVLGSVDRDAALARVQPMRSFVAAHLAPRRVSAAVLLSFAFVAFALATIGAYGVVAYSVAQRRREVGLRLALGATPVAVMRAFVQPAGLLALGGVALGVCGALITRRLVAGLLFGIEPTEPLVLLIVGGAVLLTSLAAAAIPARRAAAVDPAIALTGD